MDKIRIGCSAGFYGDSPASVPQLLRSEIHYLVSDYLAEITLAILARAKSKDPQAGYAVDFIASLAPFLAEIASRGIKVVTNAGGLNPVACRDALLRAADAAGARLRVAVVEGDDLMGRLGELRSLSPPDMFTHEPFPARPMSINAYLGARPIAAALGEGAQVVITGRCADSALVLGPLMHEFGWDDGSHDLLAAGSLAGHIVECGPQATGGVFTDWEEVPGWDDMGYPVVECAPDGSFEVTKPPGTGGLVTPGTVGEQILYEIGDPAAYVLPDVVCDLRRVRVEPSRVGSVRVSGVVGKPPTPHYKVSALHADGFRSLATLMLGGFEADRKARRVAEAILDRTRRMLAAKGYGDYRGTSVEVLGAEDTYGANARIRTAREVILKIAVWHESREALALFAQEIAPSATSMAQGITGLHGGRPRVTPVMRLHSFLMNKAEVPATVSLGGSSISVRVAAGKLLDEDKAGEMPPAALPPRGPLADVPLLALAHGRSGDKGNTVNIGLLARRPEFSPVLRAQVTAEAVACFFSHYLRGGVERYELPGLEAFNYVLSGALGGGGTASLRYDPQGKAFAQMLLDLPVSVPPEWLERGGLLEQWARKAPSCTPHP